MGHLTLFTAVFISVLYLSNAHHEECRSSCLDIKTMFPDQAKDNGVYKIKLNEADEEFPVYCDMSAGGWTMVFKTVSGITEDPFDAYNSAHVIAEEEMSALDVTNNYAGNYKNRIVLNWNNVRPTEASVVLYRRGIAVKELKFNATGTDKLNWFARDKLGGNPLPWSDIKVAPHNNFFTIEGDRTVNRRFFINSLYNGCPGDKGWMVITSGPEDTCSWAQYFGVRSILYSNLNTLTNWNDFGFVGQADVLAVYVK